MSKNNLDVIVKNNIKNYLLDDPIIDWLNKNYDSNLKKRNIFLEFIQNKEIEFEKYVIEKIKNRVSWVEIENKLDLHNKCKITSKYMKDGIDMIINPFLYNRQLKICGNPKLIVKINKIDKILNYNFNIMDKEAYIIIEIKYCKLELNENYYPKNSSKIIQTKGIGLFNNLCLSSSQKYNNTNFLLIYRDTILNNVPAIINVNEDYKLLLKVMNGITWANNLNKYAKIWDLNHLNVLGVYPNLNNKIDDGWSNIKKKILVESEDITLLWKCGLKERKIAKSKGITSWRQIYDSQNQLNLSDKTAKIIDKIVSINKSSELNLIPRKIKNWENIEILNTGKLYFICDFETVNDLNNDFDNIPSGNQIFMIGCIAVINNGEKTDFKCFKTTDINDINEINIVNQWLLYMNDIRLQYNITNPKIYHWSKAESVFFRHFCKKNNWNLKLNFVDLLDVFIKEPIVIKGAFSYGLKEIAKSLYNLNLITTDWEEDLNGMDAMTLAWNLNKDPNIINKIENYNYIDCKVIYDILLFLKTIINIIL